MTLVDLVQGGDLAGVLQELAGSTARQRALQAPELLRHRTSVANWREVAPEKKAALCAAELGCQVTPGATAAWLLQHRYFALDTWTVEVLNLYPTAWRAELAGRLGERATASDTVYTLTEHLVHDTGCRVPTSHEFVLAWLFNRAKNRARPARVLGGAPGADLLDRLRADAFTPALIPLAVARPGHLVLGRPAWLLEALLTLAAEGVADRTRLVRNLFTDMAAAPPRGTHAVPVLTALALTPAEHALVAPARTSLVGHCLGLLLQDGAGTGTRTDPRTHTRTGPRTHTRTGPRASTRTDPAQVLAFLRALAPTPAENARTVREHLALLDRPSPVATYAHEVLTGLEEAGLLEPGMLTEA